MINKKNIKQFILLTNLLLLNACTTVIKEQDSVYQTAMQCKSTDDKMISAIAKEITPQICFTPLSGCVTIINDLIDQAKHSIYLQAYSFTAEDIVDHLIKAKDRGVEINAMFDRTSFTSRGSKVHILQTHNINTSICKVPGIAHNKIIIIDNKIVITGSYNFTKATESRNAENLVIINNQEIAKQ